MHQNFTLAVFLFKLHSASRALGAFFYLFCFLSFCTFDKQIWSVIWPKRRSQNASKIHIGRFLAQITLGISRVVCFDLSLLFFIVLHVWQQIWNVIWPTLKSQAAPKSAPGHPKSSQGLPGPPRATPRARRMIPRRPPTAPGAPKTAPRRSKTAPSPPRECPRDPCHVLG
jgi:hypothetical protein